jgi:hypothetical protein
MTCQCVACARFTLQGSDLAENGFGFCRNESRSYSFVSARYERECGDFSQAAPEVEAPRRAWLEARMDELREAVKEEGFERRLGQAGQGVARLGEARRGRQGARPGVAWRGAAWRGRFGASFFQRKERM